MTAVMHAPALPAQPAAPSGAALESWLLVQRVQHGERSAFAELYLRNRDTVYKYVFFRTGSRQVAEDLTQETFARALRRIDGFTWRGTDVAAWLVTIARNLLADHFKSYRYRFEVTSSMDASESSAPDTSPEGDPEGSVLTHLTNLRVVRRVMALNPLQRQVIELRFFNGFSVAQTAAAMGRNEGSIKALQYRAVRALARMFDLDPDGDL